MDFELDDGWDVYPIYGNTNKAFMGKKNHQRLFLKRNASPFLAALSMEEITPRLIWTKRISSGDTLTAQEWLNGQTLTKQQMRLPEVAHLLARVHNSELLHRMLRKVGGQSVRPQDFIQQYLQDLPDDLRHHPLMARVLDELRGTAPTLPIIAFVTVILTTRTGYYLIANNCTWLTGIPHDLRIRRQILVCYYANMSR